jgi:hypothetical protein
LWGGELTFLRLVKFDVGVESGQTLERVNDDGLWVVDEMLRRHDLLRNAHRSSVSHARVMYED